MNVVAFDPVSPNIVLAGGDVSGILRSTDDGKTWAAANSGVVGLAQLKVASIVFSTTGEAYAAVGDQGRQGGLLASTDGGRTWKLRSTVPLFAGGNVFGTPLPQPHPRSTGVLIAVDPNKKLVYAATFHDGLMRSADDGRTWTTLGLAGEYLRGLAIDPTNPDVLYAASYGDGVFATRNASTRGSFARLTGSPPIVEEMTIVGSDLFAAAGTDGLFESSNGGSTWTKLPPTGPNWESITGYSACGATVLYAGADRAGSGGLIRSTNGGSNWSQVDDASAVHTEVGGADGPTWWLSSQPRYMLGGPLYTASQIAVEPPKGSSSCVPQLVLVAGRSGVWGTTDGAADWYPMVSGMGVTIVHGTAIDPGGTADVYAAAADWTLLFSSDAGASFAHWNGAVGAGYSIAEDPASAPSKVYLGTGSPSGASAGDVFSGSSSIPWNSTGLRAAVNGNVLAVAARTVSGNPIVIAAVQGQGVWRKQGGAGWTQVATGPLSASRASGGVSIAWASDSDVYLFDRNTGLWRSVDSGSSWTLIWSKRSVPPFTGWVAANPKNASQIYVSVGDDGLYRLDNAATGSVDAGQLQPVRMKGIQHPGPVAISGSGTVYATQLAAAGSPADIQVSADGGKHWHSIADSAYRSTAVFPLGLTVSPDGLIYVSLDGNGLLIGRIQS